MKSRERVKLALLGAALGMPLAWIVVGQCALSQTESSIILFFVIDGGLAFACAAVGPGRFTKLLETILRIINP
jgi:hypothetical protein